ncbi:MAG: AI-2E family transporter, partial [Alphaproteobacteria bacterium]
MNSTQKIFAWCVFLALFIWGFYELRDVLLPFVAGIAIAYFLDPLTTKLQQKLHSRTAALLIVFSALIIVFLLCVLIVVPIVEKQLMTFISNLPMYAALLWDKIEPFLFEMKRLFPTQMDNLRDSIAEHMSGGLKIVLSTVQRILSGSVAILNLLSLLLVTPIVAFYLLRDWEKFCAVIKKLLPREEAKTIRSLLRQMNDIISGFIRGQATVCLFLGIFYAVGLSLAGLDLGLLLGLGIGMLSFIPYVGSTLGFIMSVSLAVVQFNDWKRVAVIIVIFFLGQMLEGNVLTPKLVGEKVGLHPVWVMFALLTGAALFGFLGVLIAVPVAAIIGVLVRFGVQEYLESPLYLGTPKSDVTE